MEPSEIEAIRSFFHDSLDSPSPLCSDVPASSSSSADPLPVPSCGEPEVTPATYETDIDSEPPDVTSHWGWQQLAAMSLTDPVGTIDTQTFSTLVTAGGSSSSSSRQEVRLSRAQVEQIHATRRVLMAQQTQIAGLRTSLRRIHAGLRHRRREIVKKARDCLIAEWTAAPPVFDRHVDGIPHLALLWAVKHFWELEEESKRVDEALMERENQLVHSLEDFAELLDQLRVSVAGSVFTEGAAVAGEWAEDVLSGGEHDSKAFSQLAAAQRLRELQSQLDELDGQMVSIVELQKIENPLVSDRRLERSAVEFLRAYDERRMHLFHEYRARLSVLETLTARHGDPLRLSSHELKKSSIFEPVLIQSSRSNVFVNQWLLFQLRTSSSEAERIRSLPEWQTLRGQGWSDAGISRLALALWFSDDTVLPYSGSRMPSQATTSSEVSSIDVGASPRKRRARSASLQDPENERESTQVPVKFGGRYDTT